ncbi:hypothetical protein KOI35_24305 [Actinoplanes bogorensis]|uniref:Uncharacterized protein n=1 Tax=Paractinoplanes bogorensis TaxID=1610840 RepID=A0ABS5YU99_9ACTN|nr:hypothetical protein [Actinoplanes bogorensis]MBU2666636.1 hypothetical protein [Actinoplanes bogorensis]
MVDSAADKPTGPAAGGGFFILLGFIGLGVFVLLVIAGVRTWILGSLPTDKNHMKQFYEELDAADASGNDQLLIERLDPTVLKYSTAAQCTAYFAAHRGANIDSNYEVAEVDGPEEQGFNVGNGQVENVKVFTVTWQKIGNETDTRTTYVGDRDGGYTWFGTC